MVNRPTTYKRAIRALKPERADRRYRLPFVLAVKAASRTGHMRPAVRQADNFISAHSGLVMNVRQLQFMHSYKFLLFSTVSLLCFFIDRIWPLFCGVRHRKQMYFINHPILRRSWIFLIANTIGFSLAALPRRSSLSRYSNGIILAPSAAGQLAICAA